MIEVTCIYIAGILMAVDTNKALPISGAVLIDRGDYVQAIPQELGVRKFFPEQTLADFLIQCDTIATDRIMEQHE